MAALCLHAGRGLLEFLPAPEPGRPGGKGEGRPAEGVAVPAAGWAETHWGAGPAWAARPDEIVSRADQGRADLSSAPGRIASRAYSAALAGEALAGAARARAPAHRGPASPSPHGTVRGWIRCARACAGQLRTVAPGPLSPWTPMPCLPSSARTRSPPHWRRGRPTSSTTRMTCRSTPAGHRPPARSTPWGPPRSSWAIGSPSRRPALGRGSSCRTAASCRARPPRLTQLRRSRPSPAR